MAGRPWQPSTSINQLTSPPDSLLSKCRRSRHTKFQHNSRRCPRAVVSISCTKRPRHINLPMFSTALVRQLRRIHIVINIMMSIVKSCALMTMGGAETFFGKQRARSCGASSPFRRRASRRSRAAEPSHPDVGKTAFYAFLVATQATGGPSRCTSRPPFGRWIVDTPPAPSRNPILRTGWPRGRDRRPHQPSGALPMGAAWAATTDHRGATGRLE
jgi:hypothetical protein